jgi:hypothetical protein
MMAPLHILEVQSQQVLAAVVATIVQMEDQELQEQQELDLVEE